MGTLSAMGSKKSFGWLLDRARVESVHADKNGKHVVFVSVEEFQRLSLVSAAPVERTGYWL
jgi:hypothetical protein